MILAPHMYIITQLENNRILRHVYLHNDNFQNMRSFLERKH